MLDYVYGHDEIIAQFVAQLIPHARRGWGPNVKTIGVVENGYLIAGVVYHNYEPEAEIIEMSAAAISKRWLSRETLKRIFRYPFHQIGCQMVVMRVPADNRGLLGILASYGYRFAPVERLFGRNRDGVVCTLTREAWDDNRHNHRLRHHVVEPIREAA